MKYLSGHRQATDFVREFLRIIEQHMLVIDKDNRARALLLKPKFDELKENCEKNQSYYMTKTGHPMEMSIVPRPETVSRLSNAAQTLINQGPVALPQFRG
jgi:hypothetical protein